MADIKQVGDLEIGQDMEFQKLQWKIERVSWVIMALLVLAAAIGLIGPGPLSSATAGEKGSSLWAEYNRLERYDSPNQMLVHMNTASSGQARLWINREFVEGVELLTIAPEPERIEIDPQRFIYIFNIANPGEDVAVAFHFEPNTFGKMPVRIGLDGGNEISFWQFYYP